MNLNTFRKPSYVVFTLLLTLVFAALYFFFDMREGGLTTKLWTTHLTTPQFYLTKFGVPYFVGMLAFDVVISLLSSALLAMAIDAFRVQRATLTGSACTTGAAAALGLATFGCPTCVMPIVGTFGGLTMTKVLPLLGLEFKAVTLGLVLVMFVWITRKNQRQPAGVSFSTGMPGISAR